MTDPTVLAAMVAVESAWLQALLGRGVIPPMTGPTDLGDLVTAADCDSLARAAEDGGSPVMAVVAMLRQRAPAAVAPWIHRGLTSQDVLDSALSVSTRAVLDRLRGELLHQIRVLAALAETHRGTAMVARTLTQHAVPTTLGAKVSTWLDGVLDAYDRLVAVSTPIQIGGAAATLAASTEMARLRHVAGDPARISVDLVHDTATILGLDYRLPWHTNRSPVTAVAGALVGCTDAWGHIASDVVTLARPEIGEIAEPAGAGRGGSSTMPQKQNPILSILIRRAAIAAPALASTLHLAAALAHDERPDGSWHVEWDTLRILSRRTVAAGSQCSELLTGLRVSPERMAKNCRDTGIYAEQRSIAGLIGAPPSRSYLGAVDLIVGDVVDRARRTLKDRR
jgi:3-carboxy-cis,cis-muconate cycloisomerase